MAVQIRALLGEDPQRVNEELDRALYVEPEDPKTNLLDSLNHPNGLLVEQITSITKEDKEAMPGVKVAATGAAAAHHHHVGASKLDDDEEEDEEADHEEQRKLLSAAQEAAAIEAGRFAICVTCVLCRAAVKSWSRLMAYGRGSGCADYLFEMARYAGVRLIIPDLRVRPPPSPKDPALRRFATPLYHENDAVADD